MLHVTVLVSTIHNICMLQMLTQYLRLRGPRECRGSQSEMVPKSRSIISPVSRSADDADHISSHIYYAYYTASSSKQHVKLEATPQLRLVDYTKSSLALWRLSLYVMVDHCVSVMRNTRAATLDSLELR
jgi:hypothetical protein